jgi:hypothetical protein
VHASLRGVENLTKATGRRRAEDHAPGLARNSGSGPLAGCLLLGHASRPSAPSARRAELLPSRVGGDRPHVHIGNRTGTGGPELGPPQPANPQVISGGAEGTRTPDPHTASVVRYQLRHSPLVEG